MFDPKELEALFFESCNEFKELPHSDLWADSQHGIIDGNLGDPFWVLFEAKLDAFITQHR